MSATYDTSSGSSGRRRAEIGDRCAAVGLATGPGARSDVDAEPDGVGRHDDVAVQHRGVDAVPADGLHRDLGGPLGLLDRIEDRALAPHGPVLGQAATGLPHEPDRRVCGGQAASGGEERGVAGS